MDTNGSSGSAGQPAGLALVTGASSGIGRAFAGILAGKGYDLVIASDETRIHGVAADLQRDGRQVVSTEVDLSQPAEVERLHQTVQEQSAPLAVAVLNAGIGAHGRFDEIDLEDDLKVIDLNVRSTVHLATLLTRDMVTIGNGRLLFVASIAGKAPGPFHATYAASKAFIHSFAEAARYELADTGVTVTSLLPGPTDTSFFKRADMLDTKVARGPKASPVDVAQDGYDAMMAGKDHVVTGSRMNSAMAAASAVVPDRLAAAVAARETRTTETDQSDKEDS
jgi:short-subunit dehydrogenase